MNNTLVKDAVIVLVTLLIAGLLFTAVSLKMEWILAAERFFMQTSGVITYVAYLLYKGKSCTMRSCINYPYLNTLLARP